MNADPTPAVVAFVTIEEGDDLIASLAIAAQEPGEIVSPTSLRTPKYEFILPTDERGVSVSHESFPEEEERDRLHRIRVAPPVVTIETTSTRYELDVPKVDRRELRSAQRVLERMNFDERSFWSSPKAGFQRRRGFQASFRLVRRAGHEPAFPTSGASVLLLDDRRSKRDRQLRRSGLASHFDGCSLKRTDSARSWPSSGTTIPSFSSRTADSIGRPGYLHVENYRSNVIYCPPIRRSLPCLCASKKPSLTLSATRVAGPQSRGEPIPLSLEQPFLWTTTCDNRERPPKGLLMAPVKRSIEKTKRRIERATEHINRCGDPPLAQGTGLAVFS